MKAGESVFLTCLLFLRYPHNALHFTNHVGDATLPCRKIASLFADFTLCRKQQKRCRSYSSMLVLFDVWVLCAFWICSAPLSRLTPIEALPQAPLGALPPDPHNGFHPLTLTRGVPLDLLLASLGVGAQLWSALPIPHSSLIIPHSSFLIPNS